LAVPIPVAGPRLVPAGRHQPGGDVAEGPDREPWPGHQLTADRCATNTDSFGWRTDPYSGAREFHAGSDLAAPLGTPILAVADGVVSFTGRRGTYGGLITIEHTVGGHRVTSYYAHLYDYGIHVATGDTVAAGQQIGDVGSAGKSTGPHLHLEIHPGGASQPAVNAMDWLTQHGASGLADAGAAPAGCGRSH